MNETGPRTFRLRRYFSIASGILLLAIVLPLAYAYYVSEVDEHTSLAGMRNEMLARTYANALWPQFGEFLMREDIDAPTRKRHMQTRELDQRIREMSRGASVIKIKVYNKKGLAIYSSVLKEIGEDKSQNFGFVSASQGKQVNELTHRGTMSATEGEVENVDVVSSYIPIQFESEGEVLAVFELYSNVTETVNRIEVVSIRLLIGLFAVFLVLYLGLLLVVGRANKIIQRQYLALRDNELRLEKKTEELEREIQERLEIEQALRLSEQLAAKASRAKSEFLSAMSHELRTPMNAILGFAQLLETEPDAPLQANQSKFVHQIISAGRHLLGLIDQVLDLARIEAGKLVLSLEPVKLAPLFEETLSMVQHLIRQKQIQPIAVEVGECRVIADYGRLKQVILNLLSNAIKYNRSGGSIVIKTSSSDRFLKISIIDCGEGIPSDRLVELFQPFSRLGIESSHIEGNGIGLALCKGMVEAMGGKIGVDSKVGSGSTFWIALPEVVDEASGNNGPTGEVPPVLQHAPVHQKLHEKTVVYIEDNPANVLLMEAIFQRLDGVRLLSAHTAELGFALALQENPDLIIMDINLPGMNGFEALEKIRATPEMAHIPVIALSANAMPSVINRGLAAGFHAYFTKPIQVDSFTRAICDALGQESDEKL